jgi:multiple sugar transport system permease protein
MSTSTEVTAGAAAEQRPAGHKRQLSEGARAERRLGWLLCAPAVIVMIAVTAYPVGYAVWLSLERYNLNCRRTSSSSGWPTTARCCPRRTGGTR